MKRCFKCLVEQPLSGFYRHAQMGDGHLSKCITCTRADVAARREVKLESIREYDRQRANLPHRVEARKRISAEWAKQFPERRKAHNAVSNALRGGRLEAVDFCEGCGSTSRKTEKHHHDYSRPLMVIWLCKPCHAIADKLRRRLEAS